ncbi:hypothetical protein QR680_003712 [Steinernema hermaphroditum]|uniref:Uncharacterized protein n=1 Tax=Steinernema hermaphroditum TaxID=289476 RepID=A0AA39HMN8_9BILA|nr:hypothetical protein QR680_003712 [Steinernema hermaphroditum]
MLREVALAEYFALSVLSILTLSFMLLILRAQSFVSRWKTSPALCFVLGCHTVSAVLVFLFSTQWILICLSMMESTPSSMLRLVANGNAMVVVRQFSNCATIALFSQRIFHILYPTTSTKKFNRVVVVLLLFAFAGLAALGTYYGIDDNDAHMAPLPEGCWANHCLDFDRLRVLVWLNIALLASSLASTILGSCTLLLLHKHRKVMRSLAEQRNNRFVQYAFYALFLFETVPMTVGFFMEAVLHIVAGTYVGPYGTIGVVVDGAAQTLAYYLIAVKKKKHVVCVNVRLNERAVTTTRQTRAAKRIELSS